MRVLFIGNSFTYYHDLPHMVAQLLSCETAAVTRGGFYLRQFCDPAEEMFHQVEEQLNNGPWDRVVLQEQSFNAVGNRADFIKSMSILCARVRNAGAEPVLYASWAYREGSEKLEKTGRSYEEMDAGLKMAYALAGKNNEAPCAWVGDAFTRARESFHLYEADDYHPSIYGSYLSACVIARTLAPNASLSAWHPEEMTAEDAEKLQQLSCL